MAAGLAGAAPLPVSRESALLLHWLSICGQAPPTAGRQEVDTGGVSGGGSLEQGASAGQTMGTHSAEVNFITASAGRGSK